jgi:hypothetical protein
MLRGAANEGCVESVQKAAAAAPEFDVDVICKFKQVNWLGGC